MDSNQTRSLTIQGAVTIATERQFWEDLLISCTWCTEASIGLQKLFANYHQHDGCLDIAVSLNRY